LIIVRIFVSFCVHFMFACLFFRAFSGL